VHGGDGARAEGGAVSGRLGPRRGEQLTRRPAVVADDAVHGGGEAVARLPVVHDEHAAPGAGEGECGGQAGGAAADDDGVPGGVHVHAEQRARRRGRMARVLAETANTDRTAVTWRPTWGRWAGGCGPPARHAVGRSPSWPTRPGCPRARSRGRSPANGSPAWSASA